MSKIFFTADTHFGCEKTLKRSRRPFESVKEMDYIMISNWNRVVKRDDIVFHLGDFGNLETIKKLNGKVVLIYGNHELNNEQFVQDPKAYIEELKAMGFYSQHLSGYTTIQVEGVGEEILLTHLPSTAINGGFDMFTLFGHIHEFQKIKSFGYNVGVDVNEFTPVNEETLMHYMDVILNSKKIEEILCDL